MKRFLVAVAACSLAASLPAAAVCQQATIPLRTVGPVTAKSPMTVGAIRGLRHLPDGRVLVNDASRRQLVLFDPALATSTVVIDSTPGAANSYGRYSVPLISYLGDSTIFLDMASQSFLILDEKGKIARVTAPPKPSDVNYMMSGTPGVDAEGRLLYRSYIRAPIPTSISSSPTMSSTSPDSAPIVRADWDTGKVDTLAKFKIAGGSRMTQSVQSDGTRSFKMAVNPLSWADDWTVTTDGTIAIVRGQDYHVDWITTDGKRETSPKMAYDWRRLTDADKQTIIDSVRRQNDSVAASGNGGMRSVMQSATGAMTTTVIPINYEYAPLSEIPDYYPPIRLGSVFADRDGNIWILPYTSAQGQGPNKGLVYDVVNQKGGLTQRVQLPEGRSIAGFGRGGVIYMMSPAPLANPTDRPGSAGFYLERTVLAAGG